MLLTVLVLTLVYGGVYTQECNLIWTVRISNKGILEGQKETLPGEFTENQCIAACEAYTAFECVSLEYQKKGKKCVVNAKRKADVPKAKFKAKRGIVYRETTSVCEGCQWNWSPQVAGSFIKTKYNRVKGGKGTVEECRRKCEQRGGLNFCSAINYNLKKKKCFLLTVNKAFQKLKRSKVWDFYERKLECLHAQFTCTFDENLCNMIQATNDDMDWTRISGNSSSGNTGPDRDHTSGAGFYIYTETSNVNGGSQATIVTPRLNFAYSRCVTFWYHMLGQHISTLEVFGVRNGLQEHMAALAIRKSGLEGINQWFEARITIFNTDQISWRATKDPLSSPPQPFGGVAVDDIITFDGKCEGGQGPMTTSTTQRPVVTTTQRPVVITTTRQSPDITVTSGTGGCTNSAPLCEGNLPSGRWLDILDALPFCAGGTVTEWTYYATQAGVFYPSAWKRVPGDDSEFQLVGFNRVDAPGPGVHTFQVPAADQIDVLSSYRIGIFYDAPARGEGVVPYEDQTRDASECGKNFATGPFIATPVTSEFMPIGIRTTTGLNSSGRRTLALQAKVE